MYLTADSVANGWEPMVMLPTDLAVPDPLSRTYYMLRDSAKDDSDSQEEDRITLASDLTIESVYFSSCCTYRAGFRQRFSFQSSEAHPMHMFVKRVVIC